MPEETPDSGEKVSVDSGNVDNLIADVREELREAGSSGYSGQGTPSQPAIPETGEVVDLMA